MGFSMTYDEFAQDEAWDTSYFKEGNEVCLTREIDDFTVELWKNDSDMRWHWAVTRKEWRVDRDKHLPAMRTHSSLGAGTLDCYDSLIRAGWMARA